MSRTALLLVIASVGAVTAFACGSSAPSDPVTTGDADSGVDASLDGNGGAVPPPEYPDSAADSRARDAGAMADDASSDSDGIPACGADVQDDPKNCGVCGHSCLGGACSAGMCQAVTVASAAGISIAADAQNVYWSTASNIFKCAAPVGCGSSPTPLLTNPAYSFTQKDSLVFEPTGNQLVFSGQFVSNTLDHVEQMLTDGTSQSYFFNSIPGGTPIAVDGPAAYFSGPANGPLHGLVRGTAGAFQPTLIDPTPPTVLASDKSYIYSASPGRVEAYPKAAPQGRDVMTFTGETVMSMASDDTYVYIGTADGNIYRCPVSGGLTAIGCKPVNNPSPWSWNQGIVAGIAVDATYVYWTTSNALTVVRCLRSSSTCATPTVLATMTTGQQPSAMTQTATSLYWVTPSSIMMIAK